LTNSQQKFSVSIIWERSLEGEDVGYPLLDGEKCYLSLYKSGKVQVEAWNLDRGEKAWEVLLPYYSDVHPLLDDKQNLFVPVNSTFRGRIFALDKAQGYINWDFKGRFFILGKHSPFVFHRAELISWELAIGSQTIFVPLGASRLLALNPKTGDKIWEISLGWRWAPVRINIVDDRLYWKVGGLFFHIIDSKSGQELSSPFASSVHSEIKEPGSVYSIDQHRLFLRVKKKTVEQIVCYDLITGKKSWDIEDAFLFPIKSEEDVLYAYYRPKVADHNLFKKKYFLISIDAQTDKVGWSVPCKRIEFIQKKGPLVLIKYDTQNCQLIDARDGSIIWNSEDFLEKRRVKGKNFAIMNEEESHILYITDKKMFWMRIAM